MSRNLSARLNRLERSCAPCADLPALPDLRAVLDAPDPTQGERRALLAARLELLLARVWPLAMSGDVRAVDTATRLLDRQAELFALVPGHPDPVGEVTAEDLYRLIESAPR
ncbi:hypothetical protein [Streptomyces sp. CAI-85]|uniref:hypothetical protein n=1 Tax=Streptomyces sp. CAI-85 TaxID=1472662 RepID=UPI0015875D55|nr:hypothetical protein [Streptomyces sp. CAI-85]NUV64998.1 hypothetical protein [Streptomyces sp. CAI-85]